MISKPFFLLNKTPQSGVYLCMCLPVLTYMYLCIVPGVFSLANHLKSKYYIIIWNEIYTILNLWGTNNHSLQAINFQPELIVATLFSWGCTNKQTVNYSYFTVLFALIFCIQREPLLLPCLLLALIFWLMSCRRLAVRCLFI